MCLNKIQKADEASCIESQKVNDRKSVISIVAIF